MDDLYSKMLDSDNFSHRQKQVRQHQKNIANLYEQHPKLKNLDNEIATLQKKVANSLAERLKGNTKIDIDDPKNKLKKIIQEKNYYLKTHKIPENYLEPRWNCEFCQDRGKIYLEDTIMVCKCQKDITFLSKQKKAGLSLKLQDINFESTQFSKYPQGDKENAMAVYKMVQKYLIKLINNIKKTGRFPEGLFIHEETGSGKTHLLGCMANNLIENNVDLLYIVYADILDRIRETYNDDKKETESKILRRINTVPVLLIDDLGMEKNSEFAQKYLGQIIDHRYRNMLPTIITSNFTLSELKERSKNDMYGERVIWRCVETSSIFHLAGNLRNSV